MKKKTTKTKVEPVEKKTEKETKPELKKEEVSGLAVKSQKIKHQNNRMRRVYCDLETGEPQNKPIYALRGEEGCLPLLKDDAIFSVIDREKMANTPSGIDTQISIDDKKIGTIEWFHYIESKEKCEGKLAFLLLDKETNDFINTLIQSESAHLKVESVKTQDSDVEMVYFDRRVRFIQTEFSISTDDIVVSKVIHFIG